MSEYVNVLCCMDCLQCPNAGLCFPETFGETKSTED
jgi:hypothetical protein